MPVHTAGLSYKTDSGTVPISTIPMTVNTEINEVLTVPAGAVNLEFDVEFLHLKVYCYCIALTTTKSNGKTEAAAGQVTLNWNSTGTPAPAMTLQAKSPIWYSPVIVSPANLFAADVLKVFASNAGAVDLDVAVHIGLND